MRKSLLHLFAILALCAVASSFSSSRTVTEPTVVPKTPEGPQLSIHGIRIGMSRAEVEQRYGTGRPDGGPQHVVYGRTWVESDYYDMTRHNLSLSYDEHNRVSQVTGRELLYGGEELRVEWNDGQYSLGDFGEPNSGPLIGWNPGRGSSTIVAYTTIGVEIRLYNDDRQWFTLMTPYELPQ